ncbi:MAG: MFS transporter [Myxococcota bacterium]
MSPSPPPSESQPDPSKPLTPLTGYHYKLFFFLGVATFFEGFDFLALAQLLPNLRADMGLDKADAGLMVGAINAGTILAYLLVRKADQWGRRRVLMITIAGYTIFTLLTALSVNVVMFTLCQFAARIFLIGEWAISMVYAAEEFPADRRGMVIGVLQAFSSLGAVACAGLVPLLIQTPLEWRMVYLVGAVPLVLLAFARRGLKESKRFETQKPSLQSTPKSLTAILRTPYRTRMFQLAAIWFLTYICTHNAITFWKEFAVDERGMTDAQVGMSISIAAVASMPLVFASGKLLDVIGRRMGAVVIFSLTILGVVGAYTLSGQWMLTAALMLGIFGSSAVLPVLNAYTTELFPTHLRSDAFAWSNNLLGRIGYVLSPIALGAAAQEFGWGVTVASTAVFPFLALVLILSLLPETSNLELEQTSSV